jgi:hypothetical protein
MSQQQIDPVIDEVREIRHRISAQVEHDPAKLVEHYMKFQEQYRDRLVDTSEPPERVEQSAA